MYVEPCSLFNNKTLFTALLKGKPLFMDNYMAKSLFTIYPPLTLS